MKKYKDIFSDEFLNYFGKYKEEIGNLILEEKELKINLDKIAEVLDISIKILDFDVEHYSEKCNSNKKEIYANRREPSYRQRFKIAHELGHYILGHNDIPRNYFDYSAFVFADSINERAANRFATLLLMPKKLLQLAFQKYKEQQNLKKRPLDVDSLVESMAKSLDISKETMRYRLLNLGLIYD